MNSSFLDYNFNDNINKVLTGIGFEQPTKIQQEIIPVMRKRQNVVGISRTGSGKTHAFLLPIIEDIDYSIKQTQAIIMVPTRELASQIYLNIQEFKKEIPELSVSLVIGGTSLNKDTNLHDHIIVGTPGRLMESINKNNIIRLDYLKHMVIDEADMIFDKNFIEEADKVMALIGEDVCFSIFSATITEDMHPFFNKYFEGVKIVNIAEKHKDNIQHIIVSNKNQDKFETLVKLMGNINPYLCIIFASKKVDVDEIHRKLNERNISCITLHGDLPSRERARALKRINNLEFNYVVASDIAARGIDIDGVSHVISYDMPKELEYYIHRSGRTGRYKYTGYSYFIYNKEDERAIASLEQKGIKFEYYEIHKDKLEPAGLRSRKQKEMKSNNYDKALANKVNNRKKAKVKPNHKKKKREELQKLQRKEKQSTIKQRIRAQRKVRKNTSEFSNNDSKF